MPSDALLRATYCLNYPHEVVTLFFAPTGWQAALGQACAHPDNQRLPRGRGVRAGQTGERSPCAWGCAPPRPALGSGHGHADSHCRHPGPVGPIRRHGAPQGVFASYLWGRGHPPGRLPLLSTAGSAGCHALPGLASASCLCRSLRPLRPLSLSVVPVPLPLPLPFRRYAAAASSRVAQSLVETWATVALK